MRRGQSVIEYIILVTVVVTVFIVFLKPDGIFRQTVENILNGTVNQTNQMINDIEY